MNANYKFKKNSYSPFPYPHIVQDNIFTEETLNAIRIFWPEDDLFNNEIKGIRLLDLHHSLNDNKDTFIEKIYNLLKRKKKLSSDALNFWENFVKVDINKINEQVYECFKEKLYDKFSLKNSTPNIEFLNLMHASNKFVEHHVHNHHYHNPNWTFTILIYIDDNNKETPGTDIYEIKNSKNEDFIKYLINFSIINPILPAESNRLNKIKTIKFKKNRLFAFLDTPISYHGVKKTELSKNFDTNSRKIIRLHCSYNENTVQQIYNMNLDEYKKIRKIKNPTILTKSNNNIYKGVKYEIEKLFKDA